MDVRDILNRLTGVKGGSGQWYARCPAHDDKHQSLSVSIGQDGRVLLNCHAGCSVENVAAAMGLTVKDLFVDKPKVQERPTITEIYTYPNGAQKLRYSDKHFGWRQPDGKGGWIWNRKGLPRSLYIAGELSGVMAVAEGEKDANTLHRLGWDAVSAEDGAGEDKWHSEYTEQLKGRHVLIFQDNDDKGKAFAQETAAALNGSAKSVRVLDLSTVWPDMPEKADVSDMVEHYGDERACQLIADLTHNTPEWTPQSGPSVFDTFGFFSVPDLTDEERKPPEFIVEGMIPCGLSFLSGPPKARKTFLALQMAAAVATGNPFLGRSTKKCDVVYLDLEGSKSRVSTRSDRMTIQIPRNVYITNRVQKKLSDGLVEELRKLHRERPQIRLVIIDTYSRARGNVKGGGANAYDQDVAFLEPVQQMAIEENIAILFIHHDKKGAGFASDSFERLSGTMGISGSADAVLNLILDGKRFDGKATLEFTPRDAKGGEVNLVFDERFCEWQELVEMPAPDIRGNPVCDWIITNAPARGKIGDFFSYEDVFRYAYNCFAENAGDKVRKSIVEHKADLFSQFGIGVQIGVKSNGQRGIRLINLL